MQTKSFSFSNSIKDSKCFTKFIMMVVDGFLVHFFLPMRFIKIKFEVAIVEFELTYLFHNNLNLLFFVKH
jgi:hypothetical protein